VVLEKRGRKRVRVQRRGLGTLGSKALEADGCEEIG
jgi:hypothetical protein